MVADPAILKRIRGCPFARGGRVLVRFRANGYTLFARRSGAPPRPRLPLLPPPLRRTLGTSTADRREGRGRGALALAPRWLAASGRFRGGRHAARPRPPEPHHQSILPGPTADLQLNTISYRCISATPVPVNFRLGRLRAGGAGGSNGH